MEHNVAKVHSVGFNAVAELIAVIEFIQGHRSWCQSKAHMQLPFNH